MTDDNEKARALARATVLEYVANTTLRDSEAAILAALRAEREAGRKAERDRVVREVCAFLCNWAAALSSVTEPKLLRKAAARILSGSWDTGASGAEEAENAKR